MYCSVHSVQIMHTHMMLFSTLHSSHLFVAWSTRRFQCYPSMSYTVSYMSLGGGVWGGGGKQSPQTRAGNKTSPPQPVLGGNFSPSLPGFFCVNSPPPPAGPPKLMYDSIFSNHSISRLLVILLDDLVASVLVCNSIVNTCVFTHSRYTLQLCTQKLRILIEDSDQNRVPFLLL